MYYHASQTPNISVLEPRSSNHGIPLVYLSEKRENVLVYLSNAVEKYCKETGFAHTSPSWSKWGPYGFTKDGIQQIDEYYPNALESTYRGVSGYIYHVESLPAEAEDIQIPAAHTSAEPLKVVGYEFIPDALNAILQAERDGLIVIRRYGEHSQSWLDWAQGVLKEELESPDSTPEYRHFLTHIQSLTNKT